MAKPIKIDGKVFWVARLDADPRGFLAGWEVMSPSGEAYAVALAKEGFWTCECKAMLFGKGKLCKHISALKARYESEPNA